MGRGEELALGAALSARACEGPGDAQTRQAFAFVAIATAIISILFAAAPNLDTAAARLFYTPGLGFPLAQEPAFKLLRWLGRWIPSLVVAAVVGLTLVRLTRRQSWTWISDAGLSYVMAVFAIGPLLVANLVLKANWGRARPSQSEFFGGNLQFTPAWQLSEQCSWNCSFVSGEASMSMALIGVAFAMFRSRRPQAIAAIVAWTCVVSLNRMAFGAHFLSDALIAMGLTSLIALALKSVMLDRAPPSIPYSWARADLRQRGAAEAA